MKIEILNVSNPNLRDMHGGGFLPSSHRRRAPWRPHKPKKSWMPPRRVIYIALNAAALLVAAILILMNYTGSPEAKEVKKLIYDARQALMDKNVDACIALLDETYADNQNNTYDKIVERRQDGLGDIESVGIAIRSLAIEVDPNKRQATAKFVVRFRARVHDSSSGRTYPVAGILGDHSPLGPSWEQVTLQCLKRQNQWLIFRMDVTPVRN